MLHILLPTFLFLFCKAINYATTTHLTLTLLPVLAAANIIDGSPIPFLNHIIISLTSLMIADLATKMTLAMNQPSNTTIKAPNTESIHQPSTADPAPPCMYIQTPPPIPTSTTTKPHPTPAIATLKSRLNATTSTPSSSKPAKETAIPISDFTAADRVASLKKALNAGTPIKPMRETDTDSPFHVPGGKRVRRRSRAQ